MPFSAHIRLGVIQRSKRGTLLHDAAYRMGETVSDFFGRSRDYSASAAQHGGSVVLLPSHADNALSDPYTLLGAAAFRERRVDAQEGRTLVVSLPRSVPAPLVSCVVAYAVAPLVRAGMVIQLDVHMPDASDGNPHPHVHAWIAQRLVAGTEFGLKERSWNRLFLGNAKVFRADLAARMTRALALLGIAETIDPRSSKEAGSATRAPRLPHNLFRLAQRGHSVPAIEQQRAIERDKGEILYNVPWISPVGAPQHRPTRKSAASGKMPPTREAAETIKAVCERWRELGATFRTQVGCWGISLADGSRIVAGPTYIRSVGTPPSVAAISLMVELAAARNWQAASLEGPDEFVDTIVEQAIALGSQLIPVNRAASQKAIFRVNRNHGHRLVEEVAWMDRTGDLGRMIREHLATAANVAAEPIPPIEAFPQPRPSAQAIRHDIDTGSELFEQHKRRMADIAALALRPEQDVQRAGRSAISEDPATTDRKPSGSPESG